MPGITSWRLSANHQDPAQMDNPAQVVQDTSIRSLRFGIVL